MSRFEQNTNATKLPQNDNQSSKPKLAIKSNVDNQTPETVSEIIDQMGFGLHQIVTVGIITAVYTSQDSSTIYTAYLSSRLYVEEQLSIQTEAFMSSSFYVGYALSFPIWGFMGDKFGRKRAMVLSCLFSFAFSLLTCLSPNVYWITVFRFGVALSRG